jgi:hypothetical protein
MPLAVFGYGSLWDEETLKKRAQGAKHHCIAHLFDYRPVFDKPGITHRYLNLSEERHSVAVGVIIYVTDAQFYDLAKMEQGYHVVDVTSKVRPFGKLHEGTRVVAFIHFGLPFVRMSYINKALSGVPEGHREHWLLNVDICKAVIELDEEPLCGREMLRECRLEYLDTHEVQKFWDERTCADLEALRRNARLA